MRLTSPEIGLPVALTDIDLCDLEQFTEGSQHPAWTRLRADAPMFRQTAPDGTPFWSVTRYRDVLQVLRAPKTFGSEHGTILAVTGGDIAGGSTINLMDPPRHGWVRVPAMQTMSTHVMAAVDADVRRHVQRLARPIIEGGVDGSVGGGIDGGAGGSGGGGAVDVAELMLELPMTAIGSVLGLPPEVWREVGLAAMRGVAPGDPAYATGDVEKTLHDAHTYLFDVFSEIVRHRRKHPASDLITTLLELDFGGRPLTTQEVVLNCYSFAMGAATTTPHTAAQFILAMAERPQVWQEVTKRPSAVTGAVEEALRWSTPTNHLLRRVMRPVEVGGVRLAEGDLLCAWVASANRDETVFEEPFEFRPRRRPNRHLAFGFGRHYCIGAPAARHALGLLIEELAAGVDAFEIAGEPVHVRSNFINGLSHLPVSARRSRRSGTR